MSQDIKIKPMVKRAKSYQIQKLIRGIRMVERKRGTEKQIEKNKRRATRLQRRVEALRKIDLEYICSQFSRLTGPPSTDAIEQALSEAAMLGDCSKSPSQAVVNQQPESEPSGSEFFITDNSVISTPLRANDVRHDSRPTVSHHSSKRLSLDSLFLRSLGDEDGIAPLKTKNRKGQRARQRMWEMKYGKEAKHLKRSPRHITSNTKAKGQRSTNNDSIHPSWEASKRLKEKAHSIKQFEGTHVVFSDL